jgi:hypothetical protein
MCYFRSNQSTVRRPQNQHLPACQRRLLMECTYTFGLWQFPRAFMRKPVMCRGVDSLPGQSSVRTKSGQKRKEIWEAGSCEAKVMTRYQMRRWMDLQGAAGWVVRPETTTGRSSGRLGSPGSRVQMNLSGTDRAGLPLRWGERGLEVTAELQGTRDPSARLGRRSGSGGLTSLHRVRMTGYQPDGALLRCPGPPAPA